jgi:hypothetical protein
MSKRTGGRGQVLPLVAVCLAVLMGFAGMAVDVGFLEYQQRQQQNAADGAAIGGDQQLLYSGCGNQAAAQTAAYSDAASNGFPNGGGVIVKVENPPQSGPYSGNNCAVLVRITNSAAKTFFTKVFGFNNMPETTMAVANLVPGNACIYMLLQGQITNFHSSNINAPNCDILMNGSANFSEATVDAAGIGEVNYAGSNNSGTFSGASPSQALAAADPCPEIPGCAYLAANPPSTSSCSATYGGGSTLSQGCYNNIDLNGATVTLQPGLYVFSGASNFNKANITGSGVTIYIPAGATTNFNMASSLSLSPPTTGNYTGVTFYQVPGNSDTLNLNGGNFNVSGLVYAPSAQLNFNGAQGNYVLLVAGYANLNYSSGEDFGNPGGGNSLINKPVLSE